MRTNFTLVQYNIFLVFFSFGLFFSALPQKEANNWLYGWGEHPIRMDFNTDPVTITTSSLGTIFAAASISDENGNLLFFTKGTQIYNRHGQAMHEGYLIGDFTLMQSVLIAKKPGSNTIYYVFTSYYGLRYAIVDMSLNNGEGGVVVKNVLVHPSVAHNVAGTMHCNKTDTWIVCRQHNSKNFLSYCLSSQGLDPVPVVSPVGTATKTAQGSLKFSPDGKKIGQTAFHGPPGATLFDFNSATGEVLNPVILARTLGSFGSFGSEFSPDSKKYYCCTYTVNNGTVSSSIIQWDLCAANNTAIVSSQFTIVSTGTGAMQLAADGRIYVSKGIAKKLGVITEPCKAGALCHYQDSLITFDLSYTSQGLPNFISNYHRKKNPYLFSISTSTTCGSATLAPYIISCGQFNEIPVLHWNFGDTLSEQNVSTDPVAAHDFSGPGSYTVTLSLKYQCHSDTLKRVISIPACAGVENLSVEKYFETSPNPAADWLRVRFHGITRPAAFSVKDLLGQTVLSGSIDGSDVKVSVQDLPAGVYFFSVSSGWNNRDIKFIVQH